MSCTSRAAAQPVPRTTNVGRPVRKGMVVTARCCEVVWIVCACTIDWTAVQLRARRDAACRSIVLGASNCCPYRMCLRMVQIGYRAQPILRFCWGSNLNLATPCCCTWCMYTGVWWGPMAYTLAQNWQCACTCIGPVTRAHATHYVPASGAR